MPPLSHGAEKLQKGDEESKERVDVGGRRGVVWKMTADVLWHLLIVAHPSRCVLVCNPFTKSLNGL